MVFKDFKALRNIYEGTKMVDRCVFQHLKDTFVTWSSKNNRFP